MGVCVGARASRHNPPPQPPPPQRGEEQTEFAARLIPSHRDALSRHAPWFRQTILHPERQSTCPTNPLQPLMLGRCAVCKGYLEAETEARRALCGLAVVGRHASSFPWMHVPRQFKQKRKL
jgi:hypothetical protein